MLRAANRDVPFVRGRRDAPHDGTEACRARAAACAAVTVLPRGAVARQAWFACGTRRGTRSCVFVVRVFPVRRVRCGDTHRPCAADTRPCLSAPTSGSTFQRQRRRNLPKARWQDLAQCTRDLVSPAPARRPSHLSEHGTYLTTCRSRGRSAIPWM